jgi:hypothetical protein
LPAVLRPFVFSSMNESYPNNPHKNADNVLSLSKTIEMASRFLSTQQLNAAFDLSLRVHLFPPGRLV